MQTMVPFFLYESLGVLFLRGILEAGLPFKHPSTPGRIVSAIHSASCAWWISANDWNSAIASTFLYFVSDGIMHAANANPNKIMIVHHILGAVLCFAAVHFQLWEGYIPAADITKSLIMMETTSLSVQAAFLAFQEFDFEDLMTPALLHFIVIRVICVGHPIIKHFQTVRDSQSLFYYNLYAISCFLWLQQIFWAAMWTWRLLKRLCGFTDNEAIEKEKKKVE
jgi:hypothetical protein